MTPINDTANLVDIYSLRDGDVILFLQGPRDKYALRLGVVKGDYADRWTHRGTVDLSEGTGNVGGQPESVYMDSIIAINPNPNATLVLNLTETV